MTSLCETQVPLSAHTTLQVGGPALRLVSVDSCEAALEQVAQARAQGLPWFVLGGGSNLLVADRGFEGLIVRWTDTSIEVVEATASQVLVRVGGGLSWDAWVEHTVEQGWTGLECLSGIPGKVGAAPIQNIGAYGQEVEQVLEAVWVLDWESGERQRILHSECRFAYRTSRFKQDWKGRFLVTHVEFRLIPQGTPLIRYKELQQHMEGRPLSAAVVRETVLRIRRSKSMVWDPNDPNHRSAGSFFLNPIVSAEQAAEVERRAGRTVPNWPSSDGQVKLSAAWLIEQSGFSKGWGEGSAGLSSNHVLALINRGGARAQDLVELARQVRQGVFERFGVSLHPEPEFLGFSEPVADLIA